MSTFHRSLLSALLLFLGAASLSARAQELSYAPVQPQQPTMAQPGKIEVLEFFWYGCPHCYAMEPHVEKWLQTMPADVEFIRVPGVLNKLWMAHARAYYTAQKLGVLEKIHRPLFDALHKDHRKIFSEDELRDFFVEKGVKAEDFTRTYNSNDVEIRVKQAYVVAQNYRLTGVPAFVVNGKYATSGQLAGTYENLITTINSLVEKERAEAAVGQQ
jgi:thiol:disulfide interchange protein DsbA